MAAGAILAPQIIPIFQPNNQRVRSINTKTPVTIQSDSAGVSLFFSLDGSKPTLTGRGSVTGSRKYTEPFLLPPGRVTVRAMAVSRDGRHSSVVTKVLSVDLIEDSQSPQQVVCEAAESIMGKTSPAHPQLAQPIVCKQDQTQINTNFLQCPQGLSVHPSAHLCAQCGSGSPLHPLLLPPTGGGQQHVLCVCCGSGNPVNVSSCVTCETPLKPSSHVTCQVCSANVHPYASYCTSCGVYLQAPPTTNNIVANEISCDVTCSDTHTQVKLTPPTVERSTQTVGLHYPSGTGPIRKEQQRAPLSTVSPGRGYWRKQLDHVCAHLRSFTQNNAPFRILLGEPRLGRLVSAVVREDNYEVSLTVSFTSAQKHQANLKDRVEPVGGASGSMSRTLGQTVSLSSVTERRPT
ncbi:double zinc ribbon and ankyrin repeat-containing protein 1 isoform X2 [Gouania willdenowi]|uniref:double zinc ribbon and ankyrin repeat-containing protein 1 isoform X2 n=1 Tax=Gouania willdenowi TaxID=441366 RepID=UPI0010554F7E|nr:double zinc ribbon and ankyrin repeat-containing protein 1 isoform X2 [Gouania willdenowi]